MKLVTRLKAFGIFATCLLIILGVMTYWRFSQVELALVRNTVASNIVKDAFTLTLLNDDYIRTHGERARVQWLSQHKLLNKQIESYYIESSDDQHVLALLQQEQEAILAHFKQLQTVIEKEGTKPLSPTTSLLKTDEARLNSQLSIDTQTIVSLATILANNNNQRLTMVRQTTTAFTLGIISLLGITLILAYFLFARSISQSVQKLIEGTKELASGNLSFRFKKTGNDEFGKLAHSFNKMTAQLQELDEAKDEFLSLASHELRTPMTAIRGLVSMIMDGDYGPVSPKLTKPIANINGSTQRQIHLINNILDVSRLETGRLSFTITDFSLKEVTEEVFEVLQPIAKQKSIKLMAEVDPEIRLHGDSKWVGQILNNLVGNALKFTDKGSITIKARKKHDQIFVSVTDTGRGIATEDQQKLFRKFQQLSTTWTGKPSGSGLGLYISRETARRMGGDVWIEKSEPGHGSTFIFTMPIVS